MFSCSNQVDDVTSEVESKREESKEESKTEGTPPVDLPVDKLKPGMPRLFITSESNKNDWLSKPIAAHVVESMRTWMDPSAPDYYKLSSPAPYKEKAKISIYDRDGNKVLDEVGSKVKVRGNYTTSYDKKPFKINFDNKQSVLNLHNGEKYKNWVLFAEYKDFSSLRNATALEFSRLLDNKYYTSDYDLVEVYSNGEFWGVYVIAEAHEDKKGRFNISKNNGKNETGYLLEYDSNAEHEPEELWFSLDSSFSFRNVKDFYGNTFNWGVGNSYFTTTYTINSEILNIGQKEFIRDYMNKLFEICCDAIIKREYKQFDENYNIVSGSFTNAKDCVANLIDLDSLVEAYLSQEMACDADYYLNSFFMDLDLSPENKKKLTFEGPWDFDSALGNKRHCEDGQGVYAGKIGLDVNYDPNSKVCNPWFMLFINETWFREMVSEKWQVVQQKNILQKLLSNIDFYTNSYEDSFKRNQKRWPFCRMDEHNNVTRMAADQKEAAAILKDWLIKRFASLDNIWGGYEPNKVLVAFDADNGTPVEYKYVDKDVALTKPADPIKSGSRFLGWYDGDAKYEFNVPVTTFISLKAKWELQWTTSSEGRLSVAFGQENGIYGLIITIRSLESDGTSGLNTCEIRIPELNLGIDYRDNPDWTDIQKRPTATERETVVFVPFVKDGVEYTIQYNHARKDINEWIQETCKITALRTGIDLADLFDLSNIFNVKMNCSDDSYTMRLSEDISRYIKSGVIDPVLTGSMIIGNQYWNGNTEWIRSYYCPIKESLADYEYRNPVDITYPALKNSGYTFNRATFNEDWDAGIISKLEEKNNDLNHYDTWYVDGGLHFYVSNLDYEYTLLLNLPPENGQEATNCRKLQYKGI